MDSLLLRGRKLRPGFATIAALVFALTSAWASAQTPAPLAASLTLPKAGVLYGPYDLSLSPGDTSTAAGEELAEIYAPHDGPLDVLGIERPLNWASDQLESLFKRTGFRLGFAYTQLFQTNTAGGGKNYGGAGDFDIMTSWTLVGRGGENEGRLVFTAEDRFTIGWPPAAQLGGRVGTLINTTNAFNNRGIVVRDAYWIQRLFEGRFRFLIGRADLTDFVGSTFMQNVNNSFVNRHFSGNASIASPGHGPAAGISIRPVDTFYFTAGLANAYGRTTDIEVDSLQYGRFFYCAEIGYTPEIGELGRGRYAFMVWHQDSRSKLGLPSDQGLTIVAEQNLGERYQIFARYTLSEGNLTNVRQVGQVGFGFRGLLGATNNLTGLGFSYGVPKNNSQRDEKVLEAFQRWQVTRHTQVSLSAQCVFDPSVAATRQTVGVFSFRTRTSF